MGSLQGQAPAVQYGVFALLVVLAVLAVLASVGLWLASRRTVGGEDVARRILRNSAGPLALQLVVRAIDLAFVKVLNVLEPKQAVGEYNLAGLLVTLILATVADWGLTVWLTREVARDPTATRRVFGTTLLLRWGLALLMVPVAGLVIGLYGTLGNLHLIRSGLSAQTVLLIVLLVPSLLPAGFAAAVTALFLAHEQPTTPALVNLLNNSVTTLLQLFLLLAGYGIVGVAAAALAGTVINALVFVRLLRRRWGWPGWSWDPRLAREMLRAALPLMLNGLLVAVFFRFDTFVIQALGGGAEQVANYQVAYKYTSLALVLPPIVINAVFPMFARQALHDRAALARGYGATVRWLVLLALPLATGLSVLAPTAIRLLARPDYVAASAPALAILIWFVPFSYVNGVAQYVLIALQRQSIITWAFLATAVFNLAANIVAVPRWGINAAAAITVVSELVLYLPLHVVLQRELGRTNLVASTWRPAVAALVTAVAMWQVRADPFLAVVLGAVCYGSCLWGLRVFNAEDRRVWLRLRGKTT